jgi:hypothetical protein
LSVALEVLPIDYQLARASQYVATRYATVDLNVAGEIARGPTGSDPIEKAVWRIRGPAGSVGDDPEVSARWCAANRELGHYNLPAAA